MPIKPKIKAGDAVRYIRSGMTDSQLMEKFGLSAKGVHSLILKLLEVKVITQEEIDQRKAGYHDTTVIRRMSEDDFIKDIRSGMSDSDLMKKYALSADGLRTVFQTLMEAKAVRVEELYRTSPSVHDTVFVENMRELPRHHLAMSVDVYEFKRPEISGVLTDVTERGVGISGMSASIGQIKKLVIPVADFIEADSITFEAECRWADKDRETGEPLAGFEITKISEKCLKDLRRLIQSLPFLE